MRGPFALSRCAGGPRNASGADGHHFGRYECKKKGGIVFWSAHQGISCGSSGGLSACHFTQFLAVPEAITLPDLRSISRACRLVNSGFWSHNLARSASWEIILAKSAISLRGHLASSYGPSLPISGGASLKLSDWWRRGGPVPDGQEERAQTRLRRGIV